MDTAPLGSAKMRSSPRAESDAPELTKSAATCSDSGLAGVTVVAAAACTDRRGLLQGPELSANDTDSEGACCPFAPRGEATDRPSASRGNDALCSKSGTRETPQGSLFSCFPPFRKVREDVRDLLLRMTSGARQRSACSSPRRISRSWTPGSETSCDEK